MIRYLFSQAAASSEVIVLCSLYHFVTTNDSAGRSFTVSFNLLFFVAATLALLLLYFCMLKLTPQPSSKKGAPVLVC